MPCNRWETLVSGAGDGHVHVLPVNDLQEHAERVTCWCKPLVDTVLLEDGTPCDRLVVVHHSADGRELVERHGLQ